MAQKFFTLVPPNTNIGFVKTRWWFISVSLFLVALSVASMAYNHVVRGSALNFGIDFAGGSLVRLALEEDAQIPIDEIRTALEELGYEGSSAVIVPDAPNEVLIRVKEIVGIDETQLGKCEAAVKQVGPANLLRFNHPAGGSKIFLNFDSQVEYGELEQRLAQAGCEGKADRGFGRPEEFPVEVSLVGIGSKIAGQIDERFGSGTVQEIVHSETVGPKVGNQLKVDGIVALLYAIGFIFLYVMLRFDLRFAPGGIIALAHDAFLMIGAFALTWKEFNLQIVAAVLTIVGYSINDTIVVFDRIRERVALNRDMPIEEITDRSLNDTLSRTLLTSGTTLIVVLATYFLGSGSIRDFAFALIVGLVVGTYSSLYIASPIFLWINRRFYGGLGHLKDLEAEERARAQEALLAAESSEVDEASGRSMGEIREEIRGETGPEPEEGPGKASRRRRRRPQ